MASEITNLQKKENTNHTYNQKISKLTISNKHDERTVTFTAIESGTVRGLFHRIENSIRAIFSNLFEKKAWVPLQLENRHIDICIPNEIVGHDGLADELRNSRNLTIDKLHALIYPEKKSDDKTVIMNISEEDLREQELKELSAQLQSGTFAQELYKGEGMRQFWEGLET